MVAKAKTYFEERRDTRNGHEPQEGYREETEKAKQVKNCPRGRRREVRKEKLTRRKDGFGDSPRSAEG